MIGCVLMGLGGALYAHFVGYIAPEDFLPILTFQLWTMLIVGGAGNNRGAVLGAFWSGPCGACRAASCAASSRSTQQARAASLQVVLIGVLLAAILLVRPRGLIGEEAVVSRHAGREPRRAPDRLRPAAPRPPRRPAPGAPPRRPPCRARTGPSRGRSRRRRRRGRAASSPA